MPGIKSLGDMPRVGIGGTFGPTCTTYYFGKLIGLMPLAKWTDYSPSGTHYGITCLGFSKTNDEWNPTCGIYEMEHSRTVTPLE